MNAYINTTGGCFSPGEPMLILRVIKHCLEMSAEEEYQVPKIDRNLKVQLNEIAL
jgi:hypothetical protein